MNRRKFLAGSGAAVLALPLANGLAPGKALAQNRQRADNLIRPRALRPGDTVGLITPATYVPDPDRLWLAERTVRHFGLRPKMGRNAGRRLGTYSSTLDERLDDLHAMFRDPEVRGVFCIRGGYGSAQLLDRIDYDLIRRNPKVFLGYSDITALHLAIHQRTRLITFHGPMTLARFTDYTQEHFRRALFETAPLGRLSNPPENNALRPAHPLRALRPGTATGPLTGGNLTLITAGLGTPYEIATQGHILFLEDIDEEPYSIDRMLTQLRLAGKLNGVAGVIFGECSNCQPRGGDAYYSLGEVVANILGGLNVPVLYGLTIGHTDDQLTLPLGVAATLNADAGTLEITGAALA